MSHPLLRGPLTSIWEVQSQPRPPLHRRRRGERPFMRAASAAKKQFGKTEKTIGVLLIATGIAFLPGVTFPQFGQVG